MDDTVSISESEFVPPHVKLSKSECYVYIKNSKYHKYQGLACIVSMPMVEMIRGTLKATKTVILVHGHLSHKNAIYQPSLAQKLCDMGYLVMRFDFRGQGDSEENSNCEEGRTFAQDIQDLDSVIHSVRSKTCNNQFFHMPLSLQIVVAHSRGVLSTFKYFSDQVQSGNLNIPLLIDCCGRFQPIEILLKYDCLYPNWRKANGFWSKTYRHGKYQDYWVAYEEIISMANVDAGEFKRISPKTFIVLIYAERDQVIKPTDGVKYLEFFQPRSLYYTVSGADHHFYGLPDDENLLDLPKRNGKVNYSPQLVDLISQFLANYHPKANRGKVYDD